MRRLAILMVLAWFSLAHDGFRVRGDQIINTTVGWDGVSGYQPFGEYGLETLGQTLNSGNSHYLHDFSFNIAPWYGDLNVVFRAYLMAWDGAGAAGPVLFQSDTLSTAGLPSFGSGPYTQFAINAHDTPVDPNTDYVIILSSLGLETSGKSGAVVGARFDNPYSGGGLFFSNLTGDHFSLLTTTPWYSAGDSVDLAFEADFISTPLSVPEPTSLLMLVSALSLVTAASVMRRRAGVSRLRAGATAVMRA
jgi:hypothetical protein